jgi:FkbM family methyltransferase
MEPRALGQFATLSRFLRVVQRHPGIDRRLAALARFVKRQTHKRIVGGELVVPWEGLQLAVAPDSPAAASAYYFGRPDWWEFDFLERFLRPGDTVIDVGANVGVYTLFLAKLVGPGGAVLACEPDAHNLAALRANLARNRLRQVEAVAAAVGDREGTVHFLSGRQTQSRIAATGEPASATTTLVTMDGLCRGRSPVFAKVDVEGFEDAVLRGARGLMQRRLPRVWQLEVDPARGAQLARLAAALAATGYRCFTWRPGAGALVPCDIERASGNNLLALADVDFVTARTERQEPMHRTPARAAKR